MKAKMKQKRMLSLVLSFVLALGLIPFEPTAVHAANATVVYPMIKKQMTFSNFFGIII